MKLIRSATYWETIQLFQDPNGDYYQLTQNSLGRYSLDGPLEEDYLKPLEKDYPESLFRSFQYGPKDEKPWSEKLSELIEIPID